MNVAWHEQAKHKQREFYEKYGNKIWWEGHPTAQYINLQDNIGSILFGPSVPSEEYTSQQSAKIKNIATKIRKYFENNVSIYLVFICAYIKNKLEIKVIFRITDYVQQFYIDQDSRVYNIWQNYVLENDLPSCQYCAPMNGRYSLSEDDQVQVEFQSSPSSHLYRYCLHILDVIFFFVALFGLSIAITVQFIDDNIDQNRKNNLNYVAISAISSAALFNMFRSIFALYDFVKHF